MAIKTTLEQIEEVQAAKSAVLSGQEVSMPDGKRWRMADLAVLDAIEQRLLTKYARENGGGMTINHGIPRRD